MIYTTIQGDTWDGIAYKVYEQSHLMTLLMNANPDHTKTVIFSGNIVLKVPDKPANASETLPPWRREDG
ncbi:tail protein X [Paenibacillus wynnii]|uniref:Tail protein n=1 Tax=Paenibacillus wynnii TaxID=268407 RepID=A0A098MF65_9BACL|nr:tail protein X [Paenibacillus wynnii]KGE20638.1 tail protein [Paenibacillus wynnii]KGE20696.1 tail protein [Paenibacillus wynnii]